MSYYAQTFIPSYVKFIDMCNCSKTTNCFPASLLSLQKDKPISEPVTNITRTIRARTIITRVIMQLTQSWVPPESRSALVSLY